MRLTQIEARVRRLETGKRRDHPVVYTHPEPSDAWVAEVWQLLLVYGQFASDEDLLEALQDDIVEPL